jgi:hypothetical protein
VVLLAIAAPTALALTLLAAWNHAHFGLWLPVSGLVKRAWASEAAAGPALASALALAAVSGWLVWRRERSRQHALALLTVGGMLGLDLVCLRHVERWYLAPLLVCYAPILAALASRRRAWMQAAIALAVCGALARIPATLHAVHTTRYQAHVRGEAADYLRRLPPHSRIGAWNGGMLGYYSGQHVMILDGLANDPAFYRRVVLGRDLGGYLADERITYLVTASCRLDASTWRALSNDPHAHLEGDYVLRGATSASGCDAGFAVWQRR